MSITEPQLPQSPELLKLILEMLPVGVWVLDRDGRIVYGNAAGQKVWGGARYVAADQFGEYKGWWRDTGRLIEAAEWAAARAISQGETSLNEEIEIECFDGAHKIILNSALPIRDDHGAVIGGIVVNLDITERVALEERLQLAVDTDMLTHAYSRRRFYELLREEIGRANRYHRPLALVMFDIDRFKQINDEHGHLIGDQVLASLCKVVHGQIRKSEHLARFGGDEFMLVLPEARLEDAMRIVERLRESLAGHTFGEAGSVTCSFGIGEYLPGETGDDLIRRADRALYEAKAAGRDRLAAPPGSGD